MSEDLYIGNTDNTWFDFCKSSGPHREVNFWQPSTQHFKALNEGGTLAFRLKSPRNVIGGFGTLAVAGHFSIKQAWEEFGVSNGVSSKEKLLEIISKYRKGRDTTEYSMIGFKVLIDPIFLDEKDWFELPSDWANSIVSGKSYSNTSSEGAKVLRKIASLNMSGSAFESDRHKFEGFAEQPEKYGSVMSIRPRLRQADFRLKLVSCYEASCAITGTQIPQILEAAHIIPFSGDGVHSFENGILLRSDIHRLFDDGLIWIDDEYCVVVSPVLLNENAHQDYAALNGRKIFLPKNRQMWPSIENIQRHRKLIASL
jgi:putative restriction endonuclease